MVSFPPSFLEELRSRLALSELIGRRVKLLRAGREYKACCPFHNENTPSFYVNDQKGFYHCFGCGAHGDAIGFTMQFDRLAFPEAVERLAEQAGLSVPQSRPEDAERHREEKSLYALLDDAGRWFETQLASPAGRYAREYLEKRGLSPETIARFRLGYAPQDGKALWRDLTAKGYNEAQLMTVGLWRKSEEDGRGYAFFRDRITFPVGDRRGRIVAFGARLLSGEGPKYVNSPDHPLFRKGELLYGYSRARMAASKGEPILVVEGYMDVIALVEAGFMGAVAPLGTALTESQIELLWKLLPPPGSEPPARAPILCFDGDTAGLRAAGRAVERLMPLLGPDRSAQIAFLPEHEDPDSLLRKSGPQAMRQTLSNALPLVDAIWREATATRTLSTPEDRAGLRTALLSRVQNITHAETRELYRREMLARLDQLFAPPENSRGQRDPSQRGKPGGKSQPLPLGLVRRAPQSASQRKERILLALMLNHPALYAEFGDAFAQAHFEDPAYEKLRHDLTEILAHPHDAAPAQDAESIRLALEALGHGETLAKILSEDTYSHAGFARPDKAQDIARLGWLDVTNRELKEKMKAELQRLRAEVAKDPTGEAYKRLMALREMAAGFDDPLDEITENNI